MIYFVQHANGGPVKIGYTKQLSSLPDRVRQLQIGNAYRLHLLGAMPGTLAYESALHKHLAEYALVGEWFEPIPELLEFIHEHATIQIDVYPGPREPTWMSEWRLAMQRANRSCPN